MEQGDAANRAKRKGNGSCQEKLCLLVIDKLVLGSIAAALVYFFTSQQQRSQMAMEYQRTLFDSRRAAYVAILTKAEEARDAAALFFGSHLTPTLPSVADQDYAWRLRLSEIRKRLSNPKLGVTVGVQDFWFDEEGKRKEGLAALARLEALERARMENALYASEEIDAAVDRFITMLTRDIEPFSNEYAPSKRDPSEIAERGFKDAFEAYVILRHAIRKSLRVDEIILG